MRKVTLAACLALAALTSTHAQNLPPGHSPSATPNNRDALTIKDLIHRDEALIAGANKRGNSAQGDTAEVPHYTHANTFKAQIEVTNNSTKAIKSVSWLASLIDPGTGQLIRAYDVTTKARIAPSKTKRLLKRLATPHVNVVSANSTPTSRKSPAVADLKVKVTRVIYEDGTTSDTP